MSTNVMLSQLEAPQSNSNQNDGPRRATLASLGRFPKKTPELALNHDKSNTDIIEQAQTIQNPNYRDLSKLEYGTHLLGEGSFGQVYKGTLPDNIPCAVKLMPYVKTSDKRAFDQELALLDHLAGKNIPNIVAFYGATAGFSRCLVLEFMECGTLADFIRNGAYPIVSLTLRLEWMKQIADGAAYLHDEANIIHNDLKPANLLLTKDDSGHLIVKISDLGSGNFIGGENILSRPGTPLWQAPETIHSKNYSPASDMYSIAIISYQILTGKDNFYSEQLKEIVERYEAKEIEKEQYNQLRIEKVKAFVSNGGRPALPENASDLTNLIRKTWDQNPSERPTAKVFSKEIDGELKKLTDTPNENATTHSFSQLARAPALLGQGQFGKVYKVTLNNNETCAVKVMPHENDKQKTFFNNELKVLNQLAGKNHSNIVEFYHAGFSPDSNYGYFVMEYINGDTLTNVLKNPDYFNQYPPMLQVKWMQGIASGLAYLHDTVGVIHADLNSNNILMATDRHGNLSAKISDFGSGHLRHEQTIFNRPGTRQWQAPEILLENNCSRDSDVYSAAIIFWQIMTGEHHLYKEQYPKQIQQFISGALSFADYDKARNKIIKEYVIFGNRPKLPKECPTRVAKWIKRAWHQDPDQRPSAKLLSEKLSNENILAPQEKRCSIM